MLVEEPAVNAAGFPELARVKSKVTGSDTVKLNDVDRDTPPPSLPVTAMGNVPAGVESLVKIVNVEEQLGLHETVAKDELAPLGKPDAANEIGLLLPDFRDAVIAFCAEEPFLAALSPELESEKSNC